MWTSPPPRALAMAGWALVPLRAFLGATFCFAGLQKLSNPGFFDAANPASIQSQLHGTVRTSPIHGLVAPLVHLAVPLGVLIALAEIAIGLGTLLGLWARVAAGGGALLSLFLFLTVSFHSSPFYTGSDIVFFFAWLPLVLAGAGGVLSLDAYLAERVRMTAGAEPSAVVPVSFAVIRRVCGAFDSGRCRARRRAPCQPAGCPFLATRPATPPRIDEQELDRRSFAAGGAVAGAVAALALLGGGVAAAVGRLAGGTAGGGGGSTRQLAPSGSASPSTTSPAPATTAPAPPTTAAASGGDATTAPAPPTTAAPPAGTAIGPASAVPVGGAASFNDPATGDPALVVQPQAGTFLAFDAVCPHAGCVVEWDRAGSLFVCPCHGSEFNGRTGAVEIGPATRGLTAIRINKGSDGSLYAD